MMNTSGFENVSGSIHADFIYGNTGNNTLAGDLGNDTLRGDDGNDILYGDGRTLVDSHGTGGSGPITTWHDISTVTGDPGGNDTLLGGRGDDYLFGGRGDDTMTGNQGVDRFVIEADSGDDRVTDFAVNVDKIVFSGIAGVDDFSDLTLTKVGNNTVISWGTSDSITLDGFKPSQLHASDFEFGAPAALMSIADSGFRASGSSFELPGLQNEHAISIDSYSLIG
jgi:Ca2+-binding RTX toxin-like protein